MKLYLSFQRLKQFIQTSPYVQVVQNIQLREFICVKNSQRETNYLVLFQLKLISLSKLLYRSNQNFECLSYQIHLRADSKIFQKKKNQVLSFQDTFQIFKNFNHNNQDQLMHQKNCKVHTDFLEKYPVLFYNIKEIFLWLLELLYSCIRLLNFKDSLYFLVIILMLFQKKTEFFIHFHFLHHLHDLSYVRSDTLVDDKTKFRPLVNHHNHLILKLKFHKISHDLIK
ncbi:hypothetical protein TTHERM_001001378 (macronuclear) [Tetrahymena thermophila SB210]|uniref:Uncharacterized protein n=1 Tax=Tetrahymena thermophila (strain SB210) TaxID=312017 RepID=W7XBK6_TETTS|nr:hypothetical protein TTHERM_001001378 [Tetrahymena thermophila SB210]EWS71061.1 hypothetical protein TTHERM_001001378 [Tetrahymena thermophila SB210]|eukprot:XP_012656402.1 hypothetical protein TTHERM_001001378 [Tetrahymena thermophila SB210]